MQCYIGQADMGNSQEKGNLDLDSPQQLIRPQAENRTGKYSADSAVSAQLRSEISALTQSVRNVETGNNFISSAVGELAGASDLLALGMELASQVSNGLLTDSQRQTLNEEFNQIRTEIHRLSQFL